MKPLQFTIPVVPDKTIIIKEDFLPKFYPHLHKHKEAQLIWIIKGSGTLLVETNIHPFQPDDIFLIAPNQSHIFKSEETGDEIHSLSVFYDPETQMAPLFRLPELYQLEVFVRESSGGLKVITDTAPEIAPLMTRLKEASGLALFTGFIHILSILSESEIIPLSETVHSSLPEGEGVRMGKVYDFVLQNFTTDIPLEQVAGIASLTPQAFCRYFKKHTGATFVTFLNDLRINEAKKRLLEGKFDSITSLAYNCGFNSTTNFNRVFKNTIGISPKEYVLTFQKNLS